MGTPLRVLMVEDREEDAQLLLRELEHGGFDVTIKRVDTSEAMSAAMLTQPWDIILSDYCMPSFSGPLALALMKERKLDLPFIIVSGTVGEDVAVEMLHAGAHDFIAKGKFARLVPAIERELREAALRVERAAIDHALLVSEQMAAVGTLSAGVVHEINNPLAALIANLDFATDEVAMLAQDHLSHGAATDGPESDERAGEWIATRLREIEKSVRDAHECADRIRSIVKDLKIFSRVDTHQSDAIDVCRVLESSLRMAENEIRHRARLVKDYGDVPPVEGNESRLGQVFLNLIVNAAQAIPEGNTEKNEIRVITKQDKHGRVVIEIRDTGSGIPQPDLPRIFDPFFTTKPIGEGTGLGLSICHRIVTGFGGDIAVESQVGKGTIFRITLLAAMKDAAEATPPPVAVVSRRRGRILVVDDEPMLGNAFRRMLSAEHEVLATTSGRDAIKQVSQGERFDVILCDLMMPEMTGMDLHAELLRLAPEQAEKMVFMTGGAFTSRAREFLAQVRNPRVEKPFGANDLRALVHALLNQG